MRHFEPNPLLEVPQPDQIPQETVSQQPVQGTENSVTRQDPFDTQMEVPFLEDIVEPVFKRPEMTDFEIPPILEEMIPDETLIHKHLPKQADIDKSDIYNVLMFNRYPKCKKVIETSVTYISVTYTMSSCSTDIPSVKR